MRPADLDTPLMWISDQRVMTLHSPGVPSAGCARKGCTTHTSDWREPRGSEGNRHDVRAEAHTTLAEAAGGRTWRTGALVSGCRQSPPGPRSESLALSRPAQGAACRASEARDAPRPQPPQAPLPA